LPEAKSDSGGHSRNQVSPHEVAHSCRIVGIECHRGQDREGEHYSHNPFPCLPVVEADPNLPSFGGFAQVRLPKVDPFGYQSLALRRHDCRKEALPFGGKPQCQEFVPKVLADEHGGFGYLRFKGETPTNVDGAVRNEAGSDPGEHRVDKRGPVVKVKVHRTTRHACLAGDVAHRESLEAEALHTLFCCIENSLVGSITNA